jgi:osmoprotectant transport system permease protein
MHFINEVWAYLTDGANWTGSTGFPTLFYRQFILSLAVIIGAVLIGGCIGLALGHTGRGSLVAVNAANAFRAVPSLALLTILAIVPAISLKWGGFLAAFIALLVLAVPPILTNTYVGIREVDADVRDAATAMGLTGSQVLRRVELPLALPFIVAGIRTAAIEVVATSTLAAYVSYSDLGTPLLAGLSVNNAVEATSASLMIIVLAALFAIGIGLIQRVVTPRALRTKRRGGNFLVSGPIGKVAYPTPEDALAAST